MNIKFYMSDSFACGLIRGDIPAKYINRQAGDIRMDCKLELMESDFPGTQVMVFQRSCQPAALKRMIRAKRLGIKCVYDIDDDLFNVPECTGPIAVNYMKPEVRAAMTGFFQNADAIVASCKEMADLCRKRNPHAPIFIIPNSIDFELYDDAYWNAKPHDSIVIGWHGSWSHIDDVPLIRDAIAQIMARYPEVRFKIMGSLNSKHFGEPLEPFKDRVIDGKWINFYDLPYVLADCDIGVCALAASQFNRVRSTIKLQEYAAAGVPCVCSPMPCYQEVVKSGENGLIVESESTDGWINALSRLIESEQDRRAMGLRARKWVMDNCDIRNVSLLWADAYRQIARLP